MKPLGWLGSFSLGTDLGLLLLRVPVGLLFATHGWKKANNPADFIESVGEMGFPIPLVFAWAAIAAELVGGVSLALGLLTRPWLVAMGFTMAVAIQQNWSGGVPAMEKALLFASAFAALFLTGPGRLSADAALFRKG